MNQPNVIMTQMPTPKTSSASNEAPSQQSAAPIAAPISQQNVPMQESIQTEPVITQTQAPVSEPVQQPIVQNSSSMDAVSDMEVQLTQDGFNTDDLANEIKNGDLSTMSRKLLTEKYGALTTELMVSQYKNAIEYNKLHVQTIKTTVNEAAGGESNWKSIQAWVKSGTSGLSIEQRREINTMLESGGTSAKLAVQHLVNLQRQSPTGTVPAQLEIGTSSMQPTGIQPISRMQYSTERKKAYRTNNQVEIANLDARAKFTMTNRSDLWRPSTSNTVHRQVQKW